MDEVHLAERLIAIDTSERPGVEVALDFVAGWLEGRCVPLQEIRYGDRRCVLARVGSGPRRVMLNGHLDVVPGHPDQFVPVQRDGLLYGRGAYDMKAAVAVMMLVMADVQRSGLEGVEVEMLIVPDEERAEPGANCSEMFVRDGGVTADFVICGEPTDMHVGVQAKGVAMLELVVPGLSAHGSTPWLGENAILRAVELFHQIGRLPFMAESTALFRSPSLNLGRIAGGDALNRVPDECHLYIDVRPLPGQEMGEIIQQIRQVDPRVELEVLISRPPADLAPDHPMVTMLLDAARADAPDSRAVGRDGSSDAVAFLEVGVPAVEYGPVGAGHHGPREFVRIDSLGHYRRSLNTFLRQVAESAAVVA